MQKREVQRREDQLSGSVASKGNAKELKARVAVGMKFLSSEHSLSILVTRL